MINALFSSKSGGTKLFRRGKDQCNFGWDTIIHMYQREVARAKQQQTRMVPRLKEVFQKYTALEMRGLNLMSRLLRSCRYYQISYCFILHC